MALSRTSLEVDTLTVETLFNRGPLLSSSQSYIAFLSSIGPTFINNNSYNDIAHVHWGNNGEAGGCGCAYEYIKGGGFFQWIYLPVSTVYNSLFYSYSTPDVLLNPISSISSSNNNLSSSLYYNTDNVLSFSNTNYSTLLVLSNIDNSTLSTYNLNYSNNYNISVERYNNVSYVITNDVPGLLVTSTTFVTLLFSQNASTLLTIGSNYYTVPGAPRFIGPGLSSMYNYSLNANSNSSLVGYSTVLNSSITDFNRSNASLNQYRTNLLNTVNNVCTLLETGSSLSTLYSYSNSTILNVLSSLSSPEYYLNNEIYSFSSLVGAYFNSYIVPTMGPFISTANSSLTRLQSSLNSTLFANVSSGTISTPILVLSNIIGLQLQSTNSTIARYNYIPGFCTINFRFSTILKPIFDPLFISTNVYGYVSLSTSVTDTFSTISSSMPYFVGSNLLSSISTLNGNVSSISTNTGISNSTIIGLTSSYVTGPGISSLSTQFNSQIAASFLDYNSRVSEALEYFYSFLNVVNCIPGLSSLYSNGSTIDNIISSQTGNIYNFINITYPQAEFNFFFSNNYINYVSLSTIISTNIGNYITDGSVAYSTNLFSYSTISTNLYNTIRLLNLYSQRPNGYAYETFSSIDSLKQSTLLDVLSTIEGSNSYFKPLPILSNYSTSIDPPYILQSTFFLSVETSSIMTITSSFITKNLLVKRPSNSFVFEVDGSASIKPYSGGTVRPSIVLPNFDIYARNDPIILISTQTLSVRFSSIIFNEGDLTIKTQYNPLLGGLIGINNLNPSYALDIAMGNARKPSGITWINPSDRRIKQDICEVEINRLRYEISSLRLVQYKWNSSYAATRGLDEMPTLGFISQEVESIYPNSVIYSKEDGFTDFRILDTDQIFKAKFGLTKDLLYRASTLQSRIDILIREL